MKKQSGQILIIVIVFMVVMLVLMTGLLGYVGLNLRGGRTGLAREQALQIADGAIDKSFWRLNATAGAYGGEIGTVLGTGVFDTSVMPISASLKEITVTSYVPNKVNPVFTKQVRVRASIDTDEVSFNYGVQVGDGGLEMSNNASITGNVYSNGSIIGGNGSFITGDAFSAGPIGLIDNVDVNKQAYAHTIRDNVIGGNARGYALSNANVTGSAQMFSINNCAINGDASYTDRNACSVDGAVITPYPGEPDPDPIDFPVSDAQIADWKATAELGGTIVGNFVLTNFAAASLGPKKITGNLDLSNGAQLTLTGPLWVQGTVTISNNAILALDPAYGDLSEMVITDSVVDILNNAIFQKAGPNSYILMISTAASPDAFDIANNADALVVYAPYGTVEVAQNVRLREVTAKKLILLNGAQVLYETGLASVLFSAGPGATWTFVKGTWRELN